MTTIESMTMASEGIITIRNKDYNYTGFTAEVDASGKVTSYTFQVEANMDTTEMESLQGRKAQIGDCIDSMGIP